MGTLVTHLDNRKHIKWNNKYSVGISIIDEQHKKLLGFLNKTIDAKGHSDNKEELKKLLEEITEYSLEHFETEEAYMIKFDYPGCRYYSQEYYNFFAKVITYFDKEVNGDYHISNELIEYLKQWLVNHIQASDRQYIDCFKKNGLK